MHSQAWTCFALAILAPAIHAGTFQAFNGYKCDGSNPGKVDTIGTKPRCIQMSGRHSFEYVGNGVVIEFFPTNDCTGSTHHTQSYPDSNEFGFCFGPVDAGFDTHTVLVHTS